MKKRFLLPALIAGLGLIPAGLVTAQTFTALHSFTAFPFGTNSDGAVRPGGVVANLSGNTLYGTTFSAGGSGRGTVFAINADGSGFTNLHNFTGVSDGSQPYAGLILSGNTLYGTAYDGGSFGNGTVFKLNTDGTGFTNLHSFTAISGVSSTNSDGKHPRGLVLSGNTLYGTARMGGGSGNGTVFKVNTNGTGFTNLHSFTATFDQTSYTNSDGTDPNAGLIVSGNTLYGTAAGGGSSPRGTVFKVKTDGTGFTTLHHFTPAQFDPFTNPNSTNSDGATPQAGLILSGSTLYGTASYGGSFGDGTLFAVNTNGMDFTTLHSFSYHIDGRSLAAELILSGNTLYGAANNGGSSFNGTLFAVNTNGTGFTLLRNFTATVDSANSDGAYPSGGLILSGNTLYGTAAAGGNSGKGTVFSLSFAPRLTINRSGANVVLAWPTNFAGFDYTGFTLQSTTNLLPTDWSSVAQPTVTNVGQISVTVSTTAGRKFFRLTLQ